MKKGRWKKQHKWLGIFLCFFIMMFCVSGVILNHRATVSGIDISRKYLPGWYRYTGWNGGLLRGTTPYTDADSVRNILIYGTGGVWLTDSPGHKFTDFNKGLPEGADHRQIRCVVETPAHDLFAVSIFGLYRYNRNEKIWEPVTLAKGEDELLSDAVCRNDSLIVAGRSHLYLSTAPYSTFKKIALKAPEGYKKDVTLFRSVWLLHSGELYGTAGRLIVDSIAVVLIILCITGIIFWLFPKYIRRRHKRGKDLPMAKLIVRSSFKWHNSIGKITIILTLLLSLTGWCLRPPMMIALALTKVPAIPGSTLDSPNPWNDKLRMIRYDEDFGDWVISTSEGFYSLNNLEAEPEKIVKTPPVSVMGLNVFQKNDIGQWLCGSFSGMFVWDRTTSEITDYFTHKPVVEEAGPPFGKDAISGYSNDFQEKDFTVDYYKGTEALSQPAEFETLPMSLWNVALEVHSGRIYMGSYATYFFIFIIGIGILWCLWSGYKIRGSHLKGCSK